MTTRFEGTIDNFPEHQQTRQALLERARNLEWYHTLKLDDEYTTEGIFDLEEFNPYYIGLETLEGLDCLDVGAGNGYWSFTLESKGARSVTATDLSDYAETDFSVSPLHPRPQRAADGAYGEPLRIAATLRASKVKYMLRSIYGISPEHTGIFDVVFSGSVLMHLFAPQLALQRMARVCKRAMLIATETDIGMDGASTAKFVGHEIHYVHFIPSPSCLVNMLSACGFEKVLRGPTFFLTFRDKTTNTEKICHTAVMGLKSVADTPQGLPEPRLCTSSERTTEIEIVSAPREIKTNKDFGVVVQFSNVSDVMWRGDEKGMRITAGYEMRVKDGRKPLFRAPWKASRVEAGIFPDYLPKGTSTLVRLTGVAPERPGKIQLVPHLIQASHRFRSNEVRCDIEVI